MSSAKLLAGLMVFVLWLGSAKADEPVDGEREARIAWLKEHAIALRSIDPADEDFSDLEPLRKAIGEARIVQLGEQTHGDGATFHAKARLIKFLHQKMGFSVLAMESGLYDCRKAWELLREGKLPYEAVTHGVFGVWTGSEQFQPVIDYLGTNANSERPLELCGFDCQFTGRASVTHLQADVSRVLEQLGDESISADNRTVLTEMLAGMLKRLSTPPSQVEALARTLKIAKANTEVQDSQRKALTAFGQALAGVQPSERFPAAEIAFWRQYAASLAAEAAPSGWGEWTPRRQSIAATGRWHKTWCGWRAKPIRVKKIIVWAASFHILRNLASVQPAPASGLADFYRQVVTMGEGVSKELGDQVYTLGFVAAEGQSGTPLARPARLQPAERGSIEELMVAAEHTNAVLDFRGLDASGAWLRNELAARPLANASMKADWTKVFDGLVFTRTMYSSTVAERARPPSGRVPPIQIVQAWSGPRPGSGDYEAGVDSDVKHGGKSSVYVKSTGDAPKAFGTLVQAIAADAYRGQRLRMSGFVKAENVTGAAGLWMRVDGNELSSLAFDNMLTRPIQGTVDWQPYEIVLDLPSEATDISFGILIRGAGRVWVDDLKFDVVEKDIATTAMPAPKSKRQGKAAKGLSKEPRNLDFER